MSLPQPEFCLSIKRAPDDDGGALLQLPTRPGVFAFVDAAGHTICLAVTANLRRLVRSRLEPIVDDTGPTRRVDYNRLTQLVRALPVGSPFEADWAYLHLARKYVPNAVKAMTDRWVGWWVHVNAATPFPRFVKTAHPGSAPTGAAGQYFGPINDKHAAARFIETLQAGFDLCRYYHILIEAPNGTACAYKEMGRCPAPCDGSVSMELYQKLINAAVTFACNRQPTMDALQEHMQHLSADMNFEAAKRAKRQLSDLAPAMKPAFAHVDRLEHFRWLVVCPGEAKDTTRVFLVNGGWIAPIADVPVQCAREELAAVAECVDAQCAAHAFDFGEEELENIGLVCSHLLRPKKTATVPIVFSRFGKSCDPQLLLKSMQNLHRKLQHRTTKHATDEASETGVTDTIVDSL